MKTAMTRFLSLLLAVSLCIGTAVLPAYAADETEDNTDAVEVTEEPGQDEQTEETEAPDPTQPDAEAPDGETEEPAAEPESPDEETAEPQEEADDEYVLPEDELTGWAVPLEGDAGEPDDVELTAVPTEKQAYQAMISLKGEYYEGRHWTNDDFYQWNGGIWYGGYGCAGFAFRLSDEAFGTLPARIEENVSIGTVHVGDILRINNDSHSVIVLENHSTYVTIAEGNYNSSIHWGRTLTAAQVAAADYVVTRYPEGYFGKHFTITFDANGGSGAPADIIKSAGNTVTIPDEEPTRSGYVFCGWAASRTSAAAAYLCGDSYSKNADITLYAVWNVPSSASAVNAETGIQLKWTKVSSASGYQVWRRSEEEDAFTKVAAVSSPNTVSYNDTTAEAGVYYSYVIKVIKNSSVARTYGMLKVLQVQAPVLYQIEGSDADLDHIDLVWSYYIINLWDSYTTTVYRKAAGESGWTELTRVSDYSTSSNPAVSGFSYGGSYTDYDVAAGIVYSYQVQISVIRDDGICGDSVRSNTESASLTVRPDVISLVSSADGMQVSWKGTDDPDCKYDIFRNNHWCASMTGTSWLDTDVEDNESYTYRVRVYVKCGDGYSDYHDGASMTGTWHYSSPLPAAKITSAANNTKNITIKWGAVSGASGYNVYRAKNSGDFQLVGTVASSVLEYADTLNLVNGARYRYRVAAYQTTGEVTVLGNYSAVRTVFRLQRPTISHINCVSAGIKLEWYKNSGATGVKIYRSTNGGAMNLVYTSADNTVTSWTDTGAKTNGAKYQYKVVYYKSASSGDCSSAGVTATKYYLTPSALSLKSGSGKITLTMDRNSKATGVKIYRSRDGVNFLLVKSGAASTAWTDTNVISGMKYYYKVVGYVDEGGSRYNGAFSATKNITAS